MFIGSTPKDVRIVICEELKKIDKNREVFVGCSGNFTIDKIAYKMGFKVHSNDVSFYSKAIADIVTGKKTEYEVLDERYKEIFESWEDSKFKTLIEIIFVMNISKFSELKNDYQKNMFNSFIEKNVQFYTNTVEKFEKKTMFEFKLESFFYGDFKEHVKNSKENDIVFLFPPTYKGGYEKMYKHIDETFKYEKPSFECFDSATAGDYYLDILEKRDTMIWSDRVYKECKHLITNKVDMGEGKNDIYIYSTLSTDKRFLMQKTKVLKKTYKLVDFNYKFTEKTKVSAVVCKTELINHYKHLFMGSAVNYSEGGDFGLIFFADGKAFGFCSFSKFLSSMEKIFIQSDFVAVSSQKRISKLVIMLLKSFEVKRLISKMLKHSYKGLKTSVYTKKPVSMKYRGQFQLTQRVEKENKLVYEADFTKESLSEVYEKWTTKLEI